MLNWIGRLVGREKRDAVPITASFPELRSFLPSTDESGRVEAPAVPAEIIVLADRSVAPVKPAAEKAALRVRPLKKPDYAAALELLGGMEHSQRCLLLNIRSLGQTIYHIRPDGWLETSPINITRVIIKDWKEPLEALQSLGAIEATVGPEMVCVRSTEHSEAIKAAWVALPPQIEPKPYVKPGRTGRRGPP